MGQAAANVHVEKFVPKQGVQIETDPKASSVSKATSMGDDEGAINALIEKLEVRPSVTLIVTCMCMSHVTYFRPTLAHVTGILYTSLSFPWGR